MTTREEALNYGLTFQDVYQDAPFHDDNWILVRSRKNKKAFLWTYEYQGQVRINVKVEPEWRDFWRNTYKSVIPGYHHPDLFFTEETPLHTSSPYSSSKASADLFVLAYHRTYGLPVTISRCSNNYGPYHFPEKQIGRAHV